MRGEGHPVWVDKGISHLIGWFWQNDIDTVASCQDVHEWLPDIYGREMAGVASVLFSVNDYRKMSRCLGEPDDQRWPSDVIALSAYFRVEARRFARVEASTRRGERLFVAEVTSACVFPR